MAKQRVQWGEESRRKDIIISQLSEQLKALPAPKQTGEDPRRVPHAWWRFWEWGT
jgi:hypothetical protein